MSTICTSCGVQISSSLIIYKCRQCVYHFVCQMCERKDHNRASAAFHTLDKVFVPNVQAANSIGAPSKIDNNPQPTNTYTSPKSTIFNSDIYLYGLIGYCDHCYRLFGAEETYFACQQCPNSFAVCPSCFPLMATHHPTVHTFSKAPVAGAVTKILSNLPHDNISCDGCSKESFSGKRYQCEQCPPSYDLCEDCYGRKHTHHKFKYIQHSALHGINQEMLGRRTLDIAKKNGNSNWRDPLTGWTKSDAEQVIQEAKQEQQTYTDRQQKIINHSQQQAADLMRRTQQRTDDLQRMELWRRVYGGLSW